MVLAGVFRLGEAGVTGEAVETDSLRSSTLSPTSPQSP